MNMEREREGKREIYIYNIIYIYIYIHTWGISTYVDHVVFIMGENTNL